MLYKQSATEVFAELFYQLQAHENEQLWTVAISGICQLFAHHTIKYFRVDDLDGSQISQPSQPNEEINSPPLELLLHIFDNSDRRAIKKSLIYGFCTMIARGQYTSAMVSKMLLEYFRTIENEADAELNQILCACFSTLVKDGRTECLQSALVETILMLINAPCGRFNVHPDVVIKFVVATTVPRDPNARGNIHHRIALSFLDVLEDRDDVVELTRMLAKEMLGLCIGGSEEFRAQLKTITNGLIDSKKVTDSQAVKSLRKFMSIMDGLDVTRTTRQSVMTNAMNESGLSGISAISGHPPVSDTTEDDRTATSNSDDEIDPTMYEDADANEMGDDDVTAMGKANAATQSTARPMRRSLNPFENNTSTPMDASNVPDLSRSRLARRTGPSTNTIDSSVSVYLVR